MKYQTKTVLQGATILLGVVTFATTATAGDPPQRPKKKPTTFLSNTPEGLKSVSGRCQGRDGQCTRPGGGTHVQAQGSVTAGTAIYTFGLCKAIPQGFRNQLVVDGRLVLGIVGLQRPEETMEHKRLEAMWVKAMGAVIEINAVEGEPVFKDAITGQVLRTELVRAARR